MVILPPRTSAPAAVPAPAPAASDMRQYYEERLGVELSDLGLSVATLLDHIWSLDAMPLRINRRAQWAQATTITLECTGRLSTYDNDHLTQLVVRAHDACVRVELAAPRSPAKSFHVIFSRRDRVGGLHERHPALEQAVTRVRSVSYFGRVAPAPGVSA